VLMNDTYRLEADYSATGLIKPVQIVALERRHQDEIIKDIAEKIWSLFGQMGHAVLEKTSGSDCLQEERIKIAVYGLTIQMKPDLYQISSRHLWEYKIVSVWSALKLKLEWEQQVNIYRFGLERFNFPVDLAHVLVILRDWTITKARTERMYGNTDYPPVQVKVLPVPLWPLDQTENFIKFRLTLHEQAKNLSDADLAVQFPCSDEERWAKPTTYPVIRSMKGGPRAVSGTAKFETRADAEHWMEESGKAKPGDKIVKRWGEQTRCELYCPVAQFCHQYKAIKGE